MAYKHVLSLYLNINNRTKANQKTTMIEIWTNTIKTEGSGRVRKEIAEERGGDDGEEDESEGRH